MDMTDDYTAQNLSARQRDVMKLIVRGLSNKDIASILNLAEGLKAKECLQSAEGCLALAHKTKELDTRAALLELAYEFRTVAKRLRARRLTHSWRVAARQLTRTGLMIASLRLCERCRSEQRARRRGRRTGLR
jgi:FixJ family two-component response regulator